MKHLWSILCKNCIIEEGTRQVSLIGITESVQVQEPADGKGLTDYRRAVDSNEPLLLSLPLTIVSYWTRSKRDESEEFESRYVLRGPGGKPLGEALMSVELKEGTINRRVIFRMQALVFVGFGQYEILVQARQMGNARWTTRSKLLLEVASKPA